MWVPANSFGNGVLADLASPGSRVTVKEATMTARLVAGRAPTA